ncbi:hypothetical protein AYI68_g7161 [Smittium mucronatum]|uniref:Uncharacterized protein n=1 Tax=Smittium mucronatum TaxID=133383 RepID=A0A1R0GPG8_9FUNG|nr:hypothetical protein AYI68_g7161 [Smittium mucronatum]
MSPETEEKADHQLDQIPGYFPHSKLISLADPSKKQFSINPLFFLDPVVFLRIWSGFRFVVLSAFYFFTYILGFDRFDDRIAFENIEPFLSYSEPAAPSFHKPIGILFSIYL